ncbi:MAG: Crp/Fnr family transcriptional regulator [Bacteroidetes bacterium]|nr:Crp/Fnr family transcriptional regulator [Bacteroidota bacterium]
MNTSLILENISKHITLTEKETERFLSILEYRKLKKKHAFLQKHELVKQIAFVVKGCLRSYATDGKGYEHILQFAPEDYWITDIAGLISERPSLLTIEAVEDSEMLVFSREDQLRLFNEMPKLEHFFRIITEKSLAATHNRLIDYMSLTAQERYDGFCKRYPNLIQRLPQKQIASYIGVTPEFLSKTKSELLKKR